MRGIEMVAKTRVVVLISGGGSNLQALIDACAQSHFPAQIVCVISNNPDAGGLEKAQRAGIKTRVIDHRDYESREAFDVALQAALVAAQAQLVCLAGFMRLLTSAFVRVWEGKMLNIHPSLLPSFKGLHTHSQALDAGVKWHGCTVHIVVPEMDAGPIVVQAVVPVLPEDNAQTLGARVLEQEHMIYPQALKWLAQGSLDVDGVQVMLKTPVKIPYSQGNPSED